MRVVCLYMLYTPHLNYICIARQTIMYFAFSARAVAGAFVFYRTHIETADNYRSAPSIVLSLAL